MFDTIVGIILNYVEPDDEITEETLIKGELGLSSFDLVCLANDIYEEFKVELSVEDFRQYETVGKLSAYIEKNSK